MEPTVIRRMFVIGLGATGKQIVTEVEQSLKSLPGFSHWMRLMVVDVQTQNASAEIPADSVIDHLALGLPEKTIKQYKQARSIGEDTEDWFDPVTLENVTYPVKEENVRNIPMLGRLFFHQNRERLRKRCQRHLTDLLPPENDSLKSSSTRSEADTISIYVVGEAADGICSGIASDLGKLLHECLDRQDLGREINGLFMLPPSDEQEVDRLLNTSIALQEWNHFANASRNSTPLFYDRILLYLQDTAEPPDPEDSSAVTTHPAVKYLCTFGPWNFEEAQAWHLKMQEPSEQHVRQEQQAGPFAVITCSVLPGDGPTTAKIQNELICNCLDSLCKGTSQRESEKAARHVVETALNALHLNILQTACKQPEDHWSTYKPTGASLAAELKAFIPDSEEASSIDSGWQKLFSDKARSKPETSNIYSNWQKRLFGKSHSEKERPEKERILDETKNQLELIETELKIKEVLASNKGQRQNIIPLPDARISDAIKKKAAEFSSTFFDAIKELLKDSLPDKSIDFVDQTLIQLMQTLSVPGIDSIAYWVQIVQGAEREQLSRCQELFRQKNELYETLSKYEQEETSLPPKKKQEQQEKQEQWVQKVEETHRTLRTLVSEYLLTSIYLLCLRHIAYNGKFQGEYLDYESRLGDMGTYLKAWRELTQEKLKGLPGRGQYQPDGGVKTEYEAAQKESLTPFFILRVPLEHAVASPEGIILDNQQLRVDFENAYAQANRLAFDRATQLSERSDSPLAREQIAQLAKNLLSKRKAAKPWADPSISVQAGAWRVALLMVHPTISPQQAREFREELTHHFDTRAPLLWADAFSRQLVLIQAETGIVGIDLARYYWEQAEALSAAKLGTLFRYRHTRRDIPWLRWTPSNQMQRADADAAESIWQKLLNLPVRPAEPVFQNVEIRRTEDYLFLWFPEITASGSSVRCEQLPIRDSDMAIALLTQPQNRVLLEVLQGMVTSGV